MCFIYECMYVQLHTGQKRWVHFWATWNWELRSWKRIINTLNHWVIFSAAFLEALESQSRPVFVSTYYADPETVCFAEEKWTHLQDGEMWKWESQVWNQLPQGVRCYLWGRPWQCGLGMEKVVSTHVRSEVCSENGGLNITWASFGPDLQRHLLIALLPGPTKWPSGC